MPITAKAKGATAARPYTLIEATIKLAISSWFVPTPRKMVRCDAMRCGTVRYDTMQCDVMRCDAMRCDATHTMALIKRCRRAKNLRAKDFKARFGRRSQIIPGSARRARGGKRQMSKFHMAPRLCYVLSFDPRTYSLTHRPAPCTPYAREIFVGFIGAACSIRISLKSRHFARSRRFIQTLSLWSSFFKARDNWRVEISKELNVTFRLSSISKFWSKKFWKTLCMLRVSYHFSNLKISSFL